MKTKKKLYITSLSSEGITKPTARKPKGKFVTLKFSKPKLWTTKKADAVFSKWIRERDKKCQRCGTTNRLTCSHFWSRKYSSVRFDPENCIALCMPCHLYHWEKEKQGAYRDYMIDWLGKSEYYLLDAKAHSVVKRSEAIRELMYRMDKYELVDILKDTK